jgi:putative ABC transport system permease protein
MYGLENPVGRELRMGDMTFTVIGVFRERSSTYGISEIQKETVIVPFALMKNYTGDSYLETLQAQAGNPDEVTTLERRMERLLKDRHPPEAEYNVQTLTGILSAARNISLGLTIMLIMIAFIALLISGIGIMNIMLVTVQERTREIGIRKAIGAPRKDIMGQFLIEAFLISGGGAVVGILIGIAIPVTVQQLLPGNLRVPISGASVVVSFLVSSLTGLFFGWLPANQAAKLDPVESLRYE